MSERLEAAVKAWDHHWGDRYGDEALEEMGEEVAVALTAADAVMFSDEGVERAVIALAESDGWKAADLERLTFGGEKTLREDYQKLAGAVIAALRNQL
jgi:hypothetical protein